MARRPPVREITKERKDDIPMAGRGCGRDPLGNHGRVRACGEPGFWQRPSAQICYLDTGYTLLFRGVVPAQPDLPPPFLPHGDNARMIRVGNHYLDY